MVLVLSGIDGTRPYEEEARRIANLGYDAVLIDSTSIARDSAAKVLRGHVSKTLQMPHALPGKVALVGYSLGGGRALQAAHMSDLIAVIVAWYPATTAITNQAEFIRTMSVPTLMLAGEDDSQTISSGSSVLCCSIKTARALAAAAVAAGRPLELVSYPSTAHGFILHHGSYKPSSYDDASRRMAAKLTQFMQ